MSVNEKMTAIADTIRGFAEVTDKLSLDDMPSAIGMVHAVGYGKGDGDGYRRGYQEGVASVPDYLQYATYVFFTDMNAFGKTDVVLNIPFAGSYQSMFYSDTGVLNETVEHLTINGAYGGKIVYFDNAFCADSPDTKLKHITLNCDLSKCEDFTGAFKNRTALKIIDGEAINFSSGKSAAKISSVVYNCYALEELRVAKESIKWNINFASSPNLSNETKQSIFDGLATVTTSRTLTLHSDLKILQSQKDSANAKGWTISGGKVVSEGEYYG